jgi:hypothetical protein
LGEISRTFDLAGELHIRSLVLLIARALKLLAHKAADRDARLPRNVEQPFRQLLG